MEEKEKFSLSFHLPRFLLCKADYENKLASNKSCYFLFPSILLFIRTVLMKSIYLVCGILVTYLLIIP